MSKPGMWQGIGKVLCFAKPHWFVIALAIGCMAGYAAGEGAFLLLMKPLLNVFIEYVERMKEGAPAGPLQGLPVERLFEVGRYALLLGPLVAVMAFLQDYLRGRVVWTLLTELRDKIAGALLPQSLSFFENRRSGDLMSRITNDVNGTRTVFQEMFGRLVEHGLHFILGLVIAGLMYCKLLLVGSLAAPLIVLPIGWIAKRIRRYGRQGLEKLSDMTDVMSQMFSGIRVIKAFRMEDAEKEEFSHVNRKVRNRMVKLTAARALSAGTIQAIARVIIGAAILVMAFLISRNRFPSVNVGELCVFFGGVYFSFHALRRMVKAFNNLQECIPAADRIFELVEYVPSLQDAPDAADLREIRRGIAFRNVFFAYDEETVLHDISVEIRKGETVALIGRSGAGKSTFVALLCRFYDVTSGVVEIDDLDVRQIKRESLLGRIAIVSQQTFLFNRTIADNIRYGKRDADRTEIEAAARAANIHEFVVSLPDGYDTMCGEFGAKLSGGQRQRIAIARALLKNPEILILDEAMAGLDADSEVQVRAALQELMKGRTTFLISHDLPTIRNADRIIVLKNGRLVASGTHEELMKIGGEYSSLYALQLNVGE